MMKGIGFRLTSIMLCVILVGILATVGVATFISGGTITDETLEKLQLSTQNETNAMDKWLSYHLANMSTLSESMTWIDSLAEEQIRPIFKSMLNNNEAYFEDYMGFPDGTATTGSGYEFDYSRWTSYERPWYKLALTDPSKSHITTPYVDDQTSKLCITAVHAVTRNGELLGVIGADIFVTDLQQMTLSAQAGENSYAMLISSEGEIIVHPDADYAPMDNGDYRNLGTVANGVYAELLKDITASDGIYKRKDAKGVTKYYASGTLASTGWHFVTVLPASMVTQPIMRVIYIVVPLALAILAAAFAIIYFTIRNMISIPLKALQEFMSKASATGDITLSPEDHRTIAQFSKADHEIGHCIGATASFIIRINEVAKALEAVAGNDLTVEFAMLSEKDVMAISLKKMVGSLNDMFGEITSASKQVSSGSKQISDSAQALALGSSEQAASVAQLTAAISDIAEKTKSNADMAGRAAKLSDTIRTNAEKGNRQMDEMMAAVKEISEASKSIGKVIKVIDDIAFQTNILALNAAVEAARAGQHGKGFAVVADEVRSLASKSADAASDTGNLIANSIEKSELGARIAGETAASLMEIVAGINESNQIINDIAVSSEGQASDITQINRSITMVGEVVQANSATAEQSSAASEEMSGQFAMLEDLITQFKLKDGPPSRTALPVSRRASAPDGMEYGKY